MYCLRLCYCWPSHRAINSLPDTRTWRYHTSPLSSVSVCLSARTMLQHVESAIENSSAQFRVQFRWFFISFDPENLLNGNLFIFRHFLFDRCCLAFHDLCVVVCCSKWLPLLLGKLRTGQSDLISIHETGLFAYMVFCQQQTILFFFYVSIIVSIRFGRLSIDMFQSCPFAAAPSTCSNVMLRARAPCSNSCLQCRSSSDTPQLVKIELFTPFTNLSGASRWESVRLFVTLIDISRLVNNGSNNWKLTFLA